MFPKGIQILRNRKNVKANDPTTTPHVAFLASVSKVGKTVNHESVLRDKIVYLNNLALGFGLVLKIQYFCVKVSSQKMVGFP